MGSLVVITHFNDTDDIGSKIKAARLKKKMTQEQVAELLGVSRQTISNWENHPS